jgi:hypothetical protein
LLGCNGAAEIAVMDWPRDLDMLHLRVMKTITPDKPIWLPRSIQLPRQNAAINQLTTALFDLWCLNLDPRLFLRSKTPIARFKSGNIWYYGFAASYWEVIKAGLKQSRPSRSKGMSRISVEMSCIFALARRYLIGAVHESACIMQCIFVLNASMTRWHRTLTYIWGPEH